jgi:glyoxylase-like metal-dependent hydrolase (beta-lactamase superfamily II)
VPGLVAIPLPGHTRGSVAYLLDERVLFTGDSLAGNGRGHELVAFRDACWYSWDALAASLAKLAAHRFDRVLPGHGWPVHAAADDLQASLAALLERMRGPQARADLTRSSG